MNELIKQHNLFVSGKKHDMYLSGFIDACRVILSDEQINVAIYEAEKINKEKTDSDEDRF
jgi:hypothetical protein